MNFQNTTNESVKTLVDMLTYRRPAWSKTEKKFIKNYISPLGVTFDQKGNAIKRIGQAPILWSCHTDTVHRKQGRQHIRAKNGIFKLGPNSESTCLGADDTAGVWLMREMILAKKPGLYIFHRGEEVGGVGSDFIATKTPALVQDIQFAVAFDRHGYDDIITHQGWGRCCSDEFAYSLAQGIDMDYKLSPNGIFTDTANYIEVIGECTNVSVGYMEEHSRDEQLDYEHLFKLRDAILTLDTSKLVCKRQPGEVDSHHHVNWIKHNSNDVYSYDAYGNEIDDIYDNKDYDYVSRHSSTTMERLIRNHPDVVADWLEQQGVDVEDVADAVEVRLGYVNY